MWIRCSCRGEGCQACSGSARPGYLKITSCPLAIITPDIWEAFDAAALAKRGSWPNAGGWLDQPRVLMDGIAAIRSCEAAMQSHAPAEPDE